MNFSQLNITLFRVVNDLGKQYTSLNPAFKFIAEYTVDILAFSILIYWFTKKNNNRIMVISSCVSFVIAEIIGKILGKFHSNLQPFAVLSDVNKLIERSIDNSFPSDHTILFFSVCISFWLFRKKHGVLWVILACFVGLSRIWVGVHYPLDVIVGAIIATISALTSYLIVPKLNIVKYSLQIYEKYEGYILPTKDKFNKL
jgi:undecaprenyl-diphosphatase